MASKRAIGGIVTPTHAKVARKNSQNDTSSMRALLLGAVPRSFQLARTTKIVEVVNITRNLAGRSDVTVSSNVARMT